tara:strand:+ start:2937 stop:3215 length:279 start_codon:yes stop_codon:yes gene_type:complete
MSYENDILAKLERNKLIYNRGIAGGKLLGLSLLHVELMASSIGSNPVFLGALIKLRAKFDEELTLALESDAPMTAERYEKEARLDHYTSEEF